MKTESPVARKTDHLISNELKKVFVTSAMVADSRDRSYQILVWTWRRICERMHKRQLQMGKSRRLAVRLVVSDDGMMWILVKKRRRLDKFVNRMRVASPFINVGDDSELLIFSRRSTLSKRAKMCSVVNFHDAQGGQETDNSDRKIRNGRSRSGVVGARVTA